MPFILFVIGLLLLTAPLGGQTPLPCPYSTLTTHHLTETYWQYLDTRQGHEQTIVHQGGSDYPSFLYFRFDQRAVDVTLGIHHRTSWQLDQGRLDLPYQGNTTFCASQTEEGLLVLTYTPPGQQIERHLRFQPVHPQQTPFRRPWTDLPVVVVEPPSIKTSRSKIPWWAFWRRWNTSDVPVPAPAPIRIEVTGGGYYGGINPVYRQFVRIDTRGRLIREVHTREDGLLITKKDIPRKELEEFAAWIAAHGFFELEREYTCQDRVCRDRLQRRPKPVPLRLMVHYDDEHHLVTVPVWGEDNHQVRYVDYPPVVDQIVETIYRMADRLDE